MQIRKIFQTHTHTPGTPTPYPPTPNLTPTATQHPNPPQPHSHILQYPNPTYQISDTDSATQIQWSPRPKQPNQVPTTHIIHLRRHPTRTQKAHTTMNPDPKSKS
mmetsp:Transcript_119185/g.207456  ORF Transcript_119185/g.207456 Transcript_119185/m.207456 type:complete len:105 (-) Transcript_119185:839-1153(-)